MFHHQQQSVQPYGYPMNTQPPANAMNQQQQQQQVMAENRSSMVMYQSTSSAQQQNHTQQRPQSMFLSSTNAHGGMVGMNAQSFHQQQHQQQQYQSVSYQNQASYSAQYASALNTSQHQLSTVAPVSQPEPLVPASYLQSSPASMALQHQPVPVQHNAIPVKSNTVVITQQAAYQQSSSYRNTMQPNISYPVQTFQAPPVPVPQQPQPVIEECQTQPIVTFPEDEQQRRPSSMISLPPKSPTLATNFVSTNEGDVCVQQALLNPGWVGDRQQVLEIQGLWARRTSGMILSIHMRQCGQSPVRDVVLIMEPNTLGVEAESMQVSLLNAGQSLRENMPLRVRKTFNADSDIINLTVRYTNETGVHQYVCQPRFPFHLLFEDEETGRIGQATFLDTWRNVPTVHQFDGALSNCLRTSGDVLKAVEKKLTRNRVFVTAARQVDDLVFYSSVALTVGGQRWVLLAEVRVLTASAYESVVVTLKSINGESQLDSLVCAGMERAIRAILVS